MQFDLQQKNSPIGVGAISFINTLPIYYGLPAIFAKLDDDLVKRVQVTYGAPTQLNQAMAEGKLVLSPVSSVFYLNNQSKFTLLPGLSVSSFGAVESVLLLSRVPWEALPALETIGVPSSSETSIALLSYLLSQLGERVPRFETYVAANYAQAIEQYDAILMIGDDALKLAQNNPMTYMYDLSSLWGQQTGLPFVFAVWVAQNGWCEANPDEFAGLSYALRESIRQFWKTPAWQQDALAKAKAQFNLTGGELSEAVIWQYWTQALNFTLTPAHLQSLGQLDEFLKSAEGSVDTFLPISVAPPVSIPASLPA